MLSTDALHISTLILYIYVNLQHILPHSQCSSHYLRSSELKKIWILFKIFLGNVQSLKTIFEYKKFFER